MAVRLGALVSVVMLVFVLAVGVGSVSAVAGDSSVPVTAMAFHPTGTMLVSAGNKRIEIRSVEDPESVRYLECNLPKILALAYSPDGRFLAVGGGTSGVEGSAQILSWPDGVMRHSEVGFEDLVTGIGFDPTGSRVVISSADHSARVLELTSGVRSSAGAIHLKGHAGPVLAAGFSPSGKVVVTAGSDRSLKVWSAEDGRLIRSLTLHTEVVHALAFRRPVQDDPFPVTCATAGDDRTVRVWQPEIGRMVRIVRGHEGSVLTLAWAPDGRMLFSAGSEGVIRKIDGASDVIRKEWRAHDDWIHAIAISPDGKWLASGDWKGSVRLWPLSDL